MMMGIKRYYMGDPSRYIIRGSGASQGGAGCLSLSKGAASLVPGATEHQQKASRPWVFVKACMVGFKVLAFESINNIFYTMINLRMSRYSNFRFPVWPLSSMPGYLVLSLLFAASQVLTCWAWMDAWQFAAATPPCLTKKWNAWFAWHVGSTRLTLQMTLQ